MIYVDLLSVQIILTLGCKSACHKLTATERSGNPIQFINATVLQSVLSNKNKFRVQHCFGS